MVPNCRVCRLQRDGAVFRYDKRYASDYLTTTWEVITTEADQAVAMEDL